MNKAIVIGTHKGRGQWVAQCLDSLSGYNRYPILTIDEPYELGVIKWVYERTDLDEFLFLQDTVKLRRLEWLDEAFDFDGSVALTNQPCVFGMYMGKYRREALSKLRFPDVTTKSQAVMFESEWTGRYSHRDNYKVLFSDLDLPEKHRFEEKFGRLNLILENDHLIKWKGTWSAEQITD